MQGSEGVMTIYSIPLKPRVRQGDTERGTTQRILQSRTTAIANDTDTWTLCSRGDARQRTVLLLSTSPSTPALCELCIVRARGELGSRVLVMHLCTNKEAVEMRYIIADFLRPKLNRLFLLSLGVGRGRSVGGMLLSSRSSATASSEASWSSFLSFENRFGRFLKLKLG